MESPQLSQLTTKNTKLSHKEHKGNLGELRDLLRGLCGELLSKLTQNQIMSQRLNRSSARSNPSNVRSTSASVCAEDRRPDGPEGSMPSSKSAARTNFPMALMPVARRAGVAWSR